MSNKFELHSSEPSFILEEVDVLCEENDPPSVASISMPYDVLISYREAVDMRDWLDGLIERLIEQGRDH